MERREERGTGGVFSPCFEDRIHSSKKSIQPYSDVEWGGLYHSTIGVLLSEVLSIGTGKVNRGGLSLR